MTVTLLRANALHLPIADHTVDLVVTSPPYFSLRSYQDGGQHYPGQIGSEATPAEWVEAMLAATAEMVRCLKPCGSIWVNLGDKYATAGTRQGHTGVREFLAASQHYGGGVPGVPSKSLIGLPWRYALACIDQLGLILRAEVIWSKPNGLPESVTDRVRRSHETWLHFTVQPRYFSAVDEIREPQLHGLDRVGTANRQGTKWQERMDDGTPRFNSVDRVLHPLGKLPGSVWSIPSQPLTVPPELGVDHFAAFPMAWPRRLIAGWSPAGICTVCGDGRRPVRGVSQRLQDTLPDRRSAALTSTDRDYGWGRKLARTTAEATITGYVCACDPDICRECLRDLAACLRRGVCCTDCTHGRDAPTTPAVVLDGFGGTGTVALVAHVMGRHGITVDLSSDYCRLAAWRTTDPAQLAQAALVDKPPVQMVGQASLFDGFDPPPPKTRNGPYPERDCHNCGHRSGRTTMNCPKCGARKQEAVTG
jgi:DNA modification methylase